MLSVYSKCPQRVFTVFKVYRVKFPRKCLKSVLCLELVHNKHYQRGLTVCQVLERRISVRPVYIVKCPREVLQSVEWSYIIFNESVYSLSSVQR